MIIDILEMLTRTKAASKGHFVYKAGHNHGAGYIDKDRFPLIGAQNMVRVLDAMAEKAMKAGLNFGQHKSVGLITPAYGAIKLGLPLAAALERRTKYDICVIETEVERDANGKRYHVIAENQKQMVTGMPLIGVEDIINAGTTVHEINALTYKELGAKLSAMFCVIDRGGQTAKSLGVRYYYPYERIDMTQYDVRVSPGCPQCTAGVPINTDLGKGAAWVKMFGQPPYPPGMDFSAFWKAA